MTEEQLENIKKVTEQILTQLMVEGKVSVEKTEDSIVKVQIDTEENGLLIGRRGETLHGIQLLIGLIAQKKNNEWNTIVLNVGDYRQKREQALIEMAKQAAEQAKETKEAIVMPELSAHDRRVIHSVLSSDKDVFSESEGEGRDRRLVVKLREKQ